MKIPLIKSRNFSSHNIARSALDVPDEQFYLTAYAHGAVRVVRDAASKHFGKRFQGININSSNRATYNASVDRAAPNSHHIYRVDPNTRQLHCALDLDPIGITPRELFNFMKASFRGEIGLEEDRGVVHFAPVGVEDTAEIWS